MPILGWILPLPWTFLGCIMDWNLGQDAPLNDVSYAVRRGIINKYNNYHISGSCWSLAWYKCASFREEISADFFSVQYYPEDGGSMFFLDFCITYLTTRCNLDTDVRTWTLKSESHCSIIVLTPRVSSWGVHGDMTKGLALWVTDRRIWQEIASRWNCRCNGANNGRSVWSRGTGCGGGSGWRLSLDSIQSGCGTHDAEIS